MGVNPSPALYPLTTSFILTPSIALEVLLFVATGVDVLDGPVAVVVVAVCLSFAFSKIS